MQPFDQEIVEALTERAPRRGPGRVLLLTAHTTLGQQVEQTLSTEGHLCSVVNSVRGATQALESQTFELVLIDPCVPAKDLPALAMLTDRIQSGNPITHWAIVTSDDASTIAVDAMRRGAVDCIDVAIDSDEFLRRVDDAILKTRGEQQREEMISRLKRVCHELNITRQDISKQVDILCSDLANAYQTITQQVSEVATITEFRTLLRQELDVEDLLRTTLEYMLTKTGPTNAAVFLPDADQHYGLGAYVNYDCPRESVGMLLDHLCRAICPQMEDESEIVAFDDAEEFANWIGLEAEFLAETEIIAYSCRHDGRCLAVVVMFRNKNEPFANEVADVVDLLRPIFAEQLSHVIRIHHRATPSWPQESVDDEYDFNDDYGFGIAA